MGKIKLLESATLIISDGRGEIHVRESSDGIYNIEIIEHLKCSLRLGNRDLEYQNIESRMPESLGLSLTLRHLL